MKLRDLEAHLRRHGCRVARQGGRHTVWENPDNGLATAVPRHREMSDVLARAICDELGIPRP